MGRLKDDANVGGEAPVAPAMPAESGTDFADLLARAHKMGRNNKGAVDLELIRRLAALGCEPAVAAEFIGRKERALFRRPRVQQAWAQGVAEGKVRMHVILASESETGKSAPLKLQASHILGISEKTPPASDRKVTIEYVKDWRKPETTASNGQSKTS